MSRKRKITSACQLLLRAAEEMDRRGWCRYTLSDDNDRVCMLGSLDAAVENATLSSGFLRGYREEAAVRVEAIIQARYGSHFVSIPCWNDDADTGCKSKRQAMSVLRAAATKKGDD